LPALIERSAQVPVYDSEFQNPTGVTLTAERRKTFIIARIMD